MEISPLFSFHETHSDAFGRYTREPKAENCSLFGMRGFSVGVPLILLPRVLTLSQASLSDIPGDSQRVLGSPIKLIV
jgi:hypothetical protein